MRWRGEQACFQTQEAQNGTVENFDPYSDYNTHGKPVEGFKDGDN